MTTIPKDQSTSLCSFAAGSWQRSESVRVVVEGISPLYLGNCDSHLPSQPNGSKPFENTVETP